MEKIERRVKQLESALARKDRVIDALCETAARMRPSSWPDVRTDSRGVAERCEMFLKMAEANADRAVPK